MPLYQYKKNNEGQFKYSENIILTEDFENVMKKRGGIKTFIGNLYSGLKELRDMSKLSKILVPTFLILFGFGLIYKEFFPEIQGIIQQNAGYLDIGNTSPISDQYIDFSKYIAKPIDFPSLTEDALKQNILQEDRTSLTYSGTFYITIPSLGFDHLPIEANVDSTTESAYLNVLDTKLAHFRNTGLPISDVKNNMLVYGHSVSPNYGPTPNNAMVAFSFLPELKIGADIYIDIEGKTYHYKMSKGMVVEPTDVSVITGTKGKSTLTLVTCFPLGSNQKRYVAIARPVED